jgi:N-carbamoyl-L-amino-acid hydrolase
MMARICPAAMIFTPSVGGLSHNIAEHTDPQDVTAGADVLLHTLLALAEQALAEPAPAEPA